MHRPFRLSEASVPLPRGTRVVLKVDCAGDDGFMHRAGTLATVRDLTYDTYTPGCDRASGEADRGEPRERSVLPESPPNQEALERFVVEVRLHRLCGGG